MSNRCGSYGTGVVIKVPNECRCGGYGTGVVIKVPSEFRCGGYGTGVVIKVLSEFRCGDYGTGVVHQPQPAGRGLVNSMSAIISTPALSLFQPINYYAVIMIT